MLTMGKARWHRVKDLAGLLGDFDPDWKDRFARPEQVAEFYEDDEDFKLLCEQFIRLQ